MKKKGFTLIELLAVIVILAIIALIATPLVLKYIEKSRSESKVDSAYSFVRNLETEIANYAIKNNGKKYNKAPIGGDYYEFNDFEADKDIDTTVKGDTPDSIKVCLSSLGQVEKAMFEYGKYYVSYDGKKGSISDSDTYNSFSCNGNDAVGEKIFETNVELLAANDYIDFLTGIEPITYDDKYYYNLYVDGVAYKGLFAWGDSLTLLSGTGKYVYGIINGEMLIGGMDASTEGKHQVRLEKTAEEVYPHVVKVGKDGSDTKAEYGYQIISRELQNVDANVVVKDSENNIIVEEILSADLGNYLTFWSYSDEVYKALEEGKILTFEITQEINGESVTTVFGGTKFTKIDDFAIPIAGCEYSTIYYWGNQWIPASINGC